MNQKELLAVFEDRPDEQQIITQLITHLRKYGVRRSYLKHQMVFQEGDPPDAVYLIGRGMLKVSQSTEEGANVTFFIQKRDDVFGFAEVLLQCKRDRFAQCLTDCELLVMPSHTFIQMARQHNEISFGLLLMITSRFLLTQKAVVALVTKPVSWRLSWLIKQLGPIQKGDDHEVELELTHEEIARIIGCSRQTVSETLSEWRAKGWISYTRRKLILHDLSFIPSDFVLRKS